MSLANLNDLAEKYRADVPVAFSLHMDPAQFYLGLSAIAGAMFREMDRRIQALPDPLDIGNIAP